MNVTFLIRPAAPVVALALILTASSWSREFEDRFGRVIKADLVSHSGLDEEVVTIRKEGKEMEVRIDLFSEADQKVIRAWMAETDPVLPKRFGSLSEGMVARYDFEGLKDGAREASDMTGNGNSASFVGDVKIEPGILGAAADFDGKASALALDEGLLAEKAAFSVSFWFKTREARPGKGPWRSPSMFGQVTDGRGSGDLSIFTDAGRIGFVHGLHRDKSALSTVDVNDGEWHHLVLVGDPANKVGLYLDGRALVSTEAPERGLRAKSFTIGAMRYGDLVSWHACTIDELMLWERALSTSEVDALKVMRYRAPRK